ncbi:MAG TPA: hypothetical protein VK892_14305 [Pyrinomonadaceae bacterium]|nr:hypothetical protein [Pyrinomonadaceae bacterium]
MEIIYAPFFGITIFAVFYIASRIINERALRQLSQNEKARLIDGFSSFRIFSAVVVLLFVAIFLVAENFLFGLATSIRLAFPIAIFLLLLILSFITYKKLKKLDISESYIRTYLISLVLQYFGLAALFLPNILRSLS